MVSIHKLQRISDGQLEGRVATQSIESMTDLRQLVISHCQQHPRNHPDITSQAIAQHIPPPLQPHQPLSSSGNVLSDLTASTRLPSPPAFLLRAPPPHHQVKPFDPFNTI
jgi:neuroligin